jgi:xanthine dehydrogenase YagS FAD-binding subunit
VLPEFSYARPSTLEQAATLLADGRNRAHAGGTDLLGCLRDRVFDARTVVSLRDLEELRGLDVAPDGSLRLGALVTVAELAADSRVKARHAALSDAAASVASPQLRAQGTLGGNLCQKPRCWYYRGDFDCLRKGGPVCYAAAGENEYHCIFGGDSCYIVHPSDLAPALVALDAAVRIVGPGGAREVPLEEFFVPPAVDPARETVLGRGELVRDVVVPAPSAGLRSSYRKVRARGAWDFALAGMATALVVEAGVVRRARVVFSGVAPVPWRAPQVEAALTGRRLDARVIARAAEAAVEGASPLEKNGYKVPLLRGLVEERLEALAGDQRPNV